MGGLAVFGRVFANAFFNRCRALLSICHLSSETEIIDMTDMADISEWAVRGSMPATVPARDLDQSADVVTWEFNAYRSVNTVKEVFFLFVQLLLLSRLGPLLKLDLGAVDERTLDVG